MNKPLARVETGKVYCPMCTHTVEAEIQRNPLGPRQRSVVKPGQKCPQCSASLDAGYIFEISRAA